MRIKPFIAHRPPSRVAEQVAAPPYDVVDTDEARAIARENPLCFLHVSRPEIDLPPDTDPYADAVHQQGAATLRRFIDNGILQPAPFPALYLYRITRDDHVQTGLVAVSHVDDYDQGLIKRHEHTRKKTEDDRTRHVDLLNANTGPIFLTYRDEPSVDEIVQPVAEGAPLYDFVGEDGVRHTIWEIGKADALVQAFARIPCAYVADGHHRAASAARVARLRREANPNHTGNEEYNWFLTVFFPASHLRILPYNRCVKDLNGRDVKTFLDEVGTRFEVGRHADPSPVRACRVSMYVDGRWFGLGWTEPAKPDPIADLDVSVLQDRLLSPVLGIDDPRNNPRIEFVGGIRGTDELMRRVDTGRAAVAFSMYPTTIDQLLRVADAGQVMPPKSTWFEPKLKSGLLVHLLDG